MKSSKNGSSKGCGCGLSIIGIGIIFLILCGLIGSCFEFGKNLNNSTEEYTNDTSAWSSESVTEPQEASTTQAEVPKTENSVTEIVTTEDAKTEEDTTESLHDAKKPSKNKNTFSYDQLPEYSGIPYTEVNGNRPYFTKKELKKSNLESYSSFDTLGRCGMAIACISPKSMPTEKRGEIGMVKPSGWHTVKYNGVIDGNYLYNRCHLIAYCLAGENANEKNLITGTRYLNIEGMLPFEMDVANYVENTGHHVLYRVTPVFLDNEMVARGVLMEAQSIEDSKICFCIFAYNVQPHIVIDYQTGDSQLEEGYTIQNEQQTSQEDKTKKNKNNKEEKKQTYIVNTNTRKFHVPSCSSVKDIKEKNKKEVTCDRQKLIDEEYVPCKRCNP